MTTAKTDLLDFQHIHLQNYLIKLFPQGQIRGREFVIGNIAGDKGDSLSINLDSGVGADFATGDKYNIITLVAAKFDLSRKEASEKIKKDWNLGGQGAAIIPIKKEASEKKFTPVLPVSDDKNLSIDTNYYGEPEGIWEYRDINDKRVGYLVRFPDSKKEKTYRFFILAKEDNKWHPQQLTPRPLYNAQLLKSYDQTRNIIIHEGEKACQAGMKLCGASINITWAGGSGSVDIADWDLIKDGSRVIIIRDNDKAGEKSESKLATILLRKGCFVRVLSAGAFEGKPIGWDAADAESAGYTAEQYTAWLKENLIEFRADGDANLALTNLPIGEQENIPILINNYFKVLGMVKNRYVFYNYNSGQEEVLGRDRINKRFCLDLTANDIFYWQNNYGFEGKGGKMNVDWDQVAGALMKEAQKKGQFDMERLRGCGAWLDKRRVVFNTGRKLFINGKPYELQEFDSDFVYISRIPVVDDLSLELPQEELNKLLGLFKRFRWENPESAMLLAGWLMVAPLSGMLKWRPHIYITGMPGTGKSTIFEIMAEVLGKMATAAQGRSTEAGIRQSIDIDTLPVIFDEAETNNKLDEMNNENLMSLARASSAGGAAGIRKGTSDQTGGRNYVTKSCFCFNSITPSLKHASEFRRFTLLSLRKKDDETHEQGVMVYSEIVRDIRKIFDLESYSDKFVTTCANRAQNVNESFVIIRDISLMEREFNSNFADQLSMLLAGYWASTTARTITAEEAVKLLKSFNWKHYTPDESRENQQQLLAKLSQQVMFVDNESVSNKATYKRTIAELLEYMAYPVARDHPDNLNFRIEIVEKLLGRFGIKYDAANRSVIVSNHSEQIRTVLGGTNWAADWAGALRAINGARSSPQSVYFGSSIGTQRATIVPLTAFLADSKQLF